MAMSDLFGLSLDAMVGKETPKPEAAAAPNTVTPQKLTGIILMAVGLISTPLFIAFVHEWVLWLLMLLPLLAISMVLMLATENVMYKCALIMLWPINFILQWGAYILPIVTNVLLWQIIMPIVVLLLTKWCYRSKRRASLTKMQVMLMWAGYYMLSLGSMWLILLRANSRMLVLVYTVAEPAVLLLAAYCSIKTVQSIWQKEKGR